LHKAIIQNEKQVVFILSSLLAEENHIKNDQ